MRVFHLNSTMTIQVTFRLTVTDVNEAPQFFQQVSEAKVSEAVAKGTKVGNMTAKDPEGLDVR